MMRALAAVTAASALLCAACGGGGEVDRAWPANASGLIAQLRADVSATQLAGPSSRSAGRALASTSDLYALLIAYSDLSGCTTMVMATGAPPRVAKALSAPCPRLERAAALFTRAETLHDSAALLAATRLAAGAQPLLVRAALQARGEK